MTLYAALYTGLASFILCAGVLFALHPLAKRFGLTDKPDTRKQHKGEVALIGGIAIGFTFIAIAQPSLYLLASLCGLLVLGVLDDMLDMRPLVKLLGQISITALLIYGDDLVIVSFGTYAAQELYLGAYAAPFTIIAIVGLINAINMADGLDGLAGGVCLIALIHLVGLMIMLGYPLPTNFGTNFGGALATAIGAVTAFMIFNMGAIKGRKVFLGDSGSMVIGLLLSYFLITASTYEGGDSFPSSLIPWLIALPVIETLTLSYRRLRQKRSPFSADRTHLHHLLQNKGFAPRQILLIMGAGAIALIWIGVAIFILTPFIAPTLQGVAAGVVFIALPLFYYRLLIRNLAAHERP